MVDRGMEDKIRRKGGGILLCMVKGQRVSESTLAFSASHEACRRMAAFRLQLARSSTRPANGGKTSVSLRGPLHPCAPLARSPESRGTTPCASRGTLRATAVKPRPAFMSPEQPRAQRARSGVKGYCPLREPRGLSPSGGLASPTGREPHQTREPQGLSPSGGNPPANFHVSRAPCAPAARSPGCRGSPPAEGG